MGRNYFRKVMVNVTSWCSWTCWMWQTRLGQVKLALIQIFASNLNPSCLTFFWNGFTCLCVEIASVSKETHWRWKCLVDNCLELSCSPRVVLWTWASYLLFPYSIDAHRYTEQQVQFSITVITVTLSHCKGNFVYLNECKEWRMWSRLQWSQWDFFILGGNLQLTQAMHEKQMWKLNGN